MGIEARTGVRLIAQTRARHSGVHQRHVNAIIGEFLANNTVLDVVEKISRAIELDEMLVLGRVNKDFIAAQVLDAFHLVATNDTLHGEGVVGINPVGEPVGIGPAFTGPVPR